MQADDLKAIRDANIDVALCDFYGKITLERAVVDRERGYIVTIKSGERRWHYNLSTALRQMLEELGHGEDRDLMLFGEEIPGRNVW